MSQQTSTGYSIRSQRSMVLENNLRIEVQKIEASIEHTEKQIPKLEESKAYFTKAVAVHGQESMRWQLNEKLREISDAHGTIKACNEERARVQEAIRKLDPSPAEIQARLAQQRQLAQVANSRLEKDRKADELLKELRKLLRERVESTNELAKSATALELTMPEDGLDASRFEKLLASLPEDLFRASERWHAWFLGKQKDANPYKVIDEHLMVRETLMHHGIYHFADQILLTEEEARELQRKDRPSPVRRTPWGYVPPSIMPVQDFEAVARAATEKGISAQDVCFWNDAQNDAEAEKRYRAGGNIVPAGSAPFRDQAIAQTDSTSFVSTIKIRARVKARITRDREYEVGEIIELTGKPDAWRLVGAGMIGPP